jgi:TetR/AcrR family transcriptional regulator
LRIFLDKHPAIIYLPIGIIAKGVFVMAEEGRPVTPEDQVVPGGRRGKRERVSLKPEGPLREELMRAALTLFTQRGYSATTVRELVEAAGATKPVLYYYFGSKEGLFLELMRTHFGRLEAVVDVYRNGEGSVRARLTAMLDAGFVYVRRYHDLITRFLEEGIERGEFRPGNAGDMAWIILGTVEIAIEDQICSQASRIDRETLQRLLSLVFDGLAADNDKGKGKNV